MKNSFIQKLPKWLRFILIFLSIITIVYWIIYLIYKILCLIRFILAFISEKRNYWTFLVVLLLIGICALLLGEFYFNLEPFEKMVAWFKDSINSIRDWISEMIKS